MSLRRATRALLLGAVLSVLVPPLGVQPTTLSLTRLERASSVDVGEDVVWVLVLGTDSEGLTDAIELLGIDTDRHAAAGIAIPRDSYVDLHGSVGFARINEALNEGGPGLTARAVEELVGISPDYVLVTGGEGFLAMAEEVGRVDVESAQRFVTDDGEMVVRRGRNRFDAAEALEFATSRDDLDSDYDRARNHQALLLGFLRRVREREDEEGFMERVSLAALGGLETDVPPTDLYRLAQAVTQVDPSRVAGCIVFGVPAVRSGMSVLLPDEQLARRLGRDARSDATLDPGCRG